MSYASLGELALLEGRRPSKQEWKTWVTEDRMNLGQHTIQWNFMTDFASIPRPLLFLFGRQSAPWQRAAVLHDYLYSSTNHDQRYSDRQYYWQAKADGTSGVTAMLHYVALRLFGRPAYLGNQRKFRINPTWRYLQ